VLDLGGHEITVDNHVYSEFLSFYDVTSAITITFTSGIGGTATSGGETLSFTNVDGFEGGSSTGGVFDARLADWDVTYFDQGGESTVYGSDYNDELTASDVDNADRYYDGGAGNEHYGWHRR